MKSNILNALAIGLLFISSCSNHNSPNSSTNWTFKGISNSAPGCTTSINYVSAINSSATYADTIGVTFNVGEPPNSEVPTSNGTYTVEGGGVLYKSSQVHLTASSGGQMYTATGGDGTNQFMQVSVSGSIITMSGTNIMMVNLDNPTDSAPITFHLVR